MHEFESNDDGSHRILENISAIYQKAIWLHAQAVFMLFERDYGRTPNEVESQTIMTESCLAFLENTSTESCSILEELGFNLEDLRNIVKSKNTELKSIITQEHGKQEHIEQKYHKLEFEVGEEFEPLDEDFFKWLRE